MRTVARFFAAIGGFFVGFIISIAILDPVTDTTGDSSLWIMVWSFVGMLIAMRLVPKNFDSEDDDQEPEIHNQTYTDNRKVDNRKVYHITTSNPQDAERIIAKLEESDRDAIIEIDGDEIIERQLPSSKRSQRFLPKSK